MGARMGKGWHLPPHPEFAKHICASGGKELKVKEGWKELRKLTKGFALPWKYAFGRSCTVPVEVIRLSKSVSHARTLQIPQPTRIPSFIAL